MNFRPAGTTQITRKRNDTPSSRGSNWIKVQPPRYGFVMDQDCSWLVKRLPATLVEPQTKINVIIRNGKIAFIEPADGKKTLSVNHEAGARDR